MADVGTGDRLAAAARAIAALIVLSAVWLFAVEAWRVRWPAMQVGFVAVGWPLVVFAWRPVLPTGWRWTLGLAALLVWIDLLLDWWLDRPADRELAAAPWEAARLAALAVGAFAAARLPPSVLQRRVRAALIALSSAFAALLAGLVLFIALAAGRDDTTRADAALVLGLALADDGSPQPGLVARIDRAAALYQAGLAPQLVVSGGGDRHGLTEAGVMRELLVARGVPTEVIKLDTHARSTEENFACAVPLLAELHARTVLVVTERWHMPRALYQGARYAGDEVELLAAPAAGPSWQRIRPRSQLLVSEAVAYLFERVRRIGGSPTSCP
jgi:uncharacterized SAM-binding protein YcdF (DUF218 family)